MTSLPMYAAIMGDTFLRLSAPVQQFHRLTGQQVLHGWAAVSAPVSWPAKLLALLLGTPLTASHGHIKFELKAEPEVETWTRYFPTKTMCSTLTRNGATVVEKLGAARLTFCLREQEGALEMRLERLHFFGLPCPAWLMPAVAARETGVQGQLHFQIQASVRGIGLVSGYHGYLELP